MSVSLMKKPCALLPIAMSLAALLLLLSQPTQLQRLLAYAAESVMMR